MVIGRRSFFISQESVTSIRTVFGRDVDSDVMSAECLGDNGGSPRADKGVEDHTCDGRADDSVDQILGKGSWVWIVSLLRKLPDITNCIRTRDQRELLSGSLLVSGCSSRMR